MTNTKSNNREYFTTPENFFIISTFAGTNATCTHQEFTVGKGEKNVKGQYRLTYTCTNCLAHRIFFLYAKTAKKGGRK